MFATRSLHTCRKLLLVNHRLRPRFQNSCEPIVCYVCHTCSPQVVIGQFSERTHVIRKISTQHRKKDTRLTFDVVAQSKHQVQGMIQGPTRFFVSSTAKSSVGNIMGDIQKTEERALDECTTNRMHPTKQTVWVSRHTYSMLSCWKSWKNGSLLDLVGQTRTTNNSNSERQERPGLASRPSLG